MYALSQTTCAGALLDNQFLHQRTNGADLSQWLADTFTRYRRLEGRKSLYYALLTKAHVPIPPHRYFNDWNQLLCLLSEVPQVVKFDTTSTLGPQTVVLTSSNNLDQLKQFSGLGGLVQQWVPGKEFTITIAVGKKNWVPIGSAVDYKKRYNNDQGPNTFGMGSIAPCNYVPDQTSVIIDKVVECLQAKFQYQGLLSCQFIVNHNSLWLLELNTRICDPEFQSMAQRLDQSFVDTLVELKTDQYLTPPIQSNLNAITVNLVHGNWPEHQAQRPDINLHHSVLIITKMSGLWDFNTYWGSVTHSGPHNHLDLSTYLYNWLSLQNCAPFEYRTDIGQ